MKTLQAQVKSGKKRKPAAKPQAKAAKPKPSPKVKASKAKPAPKPAQAEGDSTHDKKGRKVPTENDPRFSLSKFGGSKVDSRGLPRARHTVKSGGLESKAVPKSTAQYYKQLRADRGDDVEDSADDEQAEVASDSSFEDDSLSLGSDVFENEEKEELMEEATRRIALKNCDWDHLEASQLYALIQSFTPRGGALVGVNIYISEFGKEQLEHERKHGPNIWVKRGDDDYDADAAAAEEEEEGLKFEPEPNSDDEHVDFENDFEEDNPEIKTEIAGDGERFSENKYRRYELQRLRYYYAIAEFDSAETAAHVYRECDGTEIERSGNTFDLSFVPDDMIFEDPKDTCTQLSGSYQGTTFVTNALQNSRFAISWDQTDPKRKQALSRVFDVEDDDDIGAYLAPASDDDDSETAGLSPEEKQKAIRRKYASLFESLGGLPEEKPDEGGDAGSEDDADESDEDARGIQAEWSDDDIDSDDAALVAQQLGELEEGEEDEEDEEAEAGVPGGVEGDDEGVMGNLTSTLHIGAKEGAHDLRNTLRLKQERENETAWEKRLRLKKEGRRKAKKDRAQQRKDGDDEDDNESDDGKARRLQKLKAVMGDDGEEPEEKQTRGKRDKRKAHKAKKVEAAAKEREQKRSQRMQAVVSDLSLPKESKPEPKKVSTAATKTASRFGKLADTRFALDPSHPKYADNQGLKDVDVEVRATRKRKKSDVTATSAPDSHVTTPDIDSSVAFFKKKARK